MSKVNSERGGCVDVFHASLLQGAHYAGKYDFPVIKEEHEVPRRMIPFSKALQEKKDFDMPYSMQLWNIFRSRTIGAWLQQQGIKVIPNIRFGDTRTFDCCCDGISKHSVIAIGSLGCLKVKAYRPTFEAGIEHVARLLQPEAIVFYGSAPGNTPEIKKLGVNVVIIKPQSFHSTKEVKR